MKVPPVFDAFQNIVDIHIGRIVAGDVIGRIDQVGGLNRALAEAQMADRDAARFLGIIGEVGLGVHIGVVADDLDGAFVGPDRAVGAQPPEFALHGALLRDIEALFHRQRSLGHIVGDAHCEVILRSGRGHVVVHRLDHGGIEFL
jgi:hypothetical protein